MLIAIVLIILVGYSIFNSINNRSKAVTKNNSVKNLKTIFRNDLFIGDSISKGLSTYRILDERNVCAKVGIDTGRLKNEFDKVNDFIPKRVFIMCGVNDINSGISIDQFENNYLEIIDKIKTRFPKSDVYVQSILPVLSEVKGERSNVTNDNIKKYNDRLIEVCREENITYINTASILKDNKDLYAGDGLHFQYQFYPLWLNYLLKSVN